MVVGCKKLAANRASRDPSRRSAQGSRKPVPKSAHSSYNRNPGTPDYFHGLRPGAEPRRREFPSLSNGEIFRSLSKWKGAKWIK